MCAKGPIELELAGRLGNYETEVDFVFDFVSSVRDFLLFPPVCSENDFTGRVEYSGPQVDQDA